MSDGYADDDSGRGRKRGDKIGVRFNKALNKMKIRSRSKSREHDDEPRSSSLPPQTGRGKWVEDTSTTSASALSQSDHAGRDESSDRSVVSTSSHPSEDPKNALVMSSPKSEKESASSSSTRKTSKSKDKSSSSREGTVGSGSNTSSSESRQRRRGMVKITAEQRRELMERLNEDFTDFLIQNQQAMLARQSGNSTARSGTGTSGTDYNYAGSEEASTARLGNAIPLTLAASNNLLKQFFATVDIICSTTPKPTATVNMIWSVYEDFMYPRISDHYNHYVYTDEVFDEEDGRKSLIGAVIGFSAGDDAREKKKKMKDGSSEFMSTDFSSLSFRSVAEIHPGLRSGSSTTTEIYEDVTAAQAAAVITWIDKLLTTLQEASNRGEGKKSVTIHSRPAWKKDQERLLRHYMSGVRKDMVRFIEKTFNLESETDIQQELTSFPEQYEALLGLHLKRAKKLLPSQYHELVLVVCNEELAIYVEQEMLLISTRWKSLTTGRFCSIINDSSRLSDQCEEFNDAWLRTEEYQKAGSDLVSDLAELSLHATQHLCLRTIYDPPADPILNGIGDVYWETDPRHTSINGMIRTLQEFLEELENFLRAEDFHWSKIIKCCFDYTIQAYIESFIANTLINGVQSCKAVARNLAYDYVRLKNFFVFNEKVKSFHGQDGFYSVGEIEKRLRVLNSLAMLVDPSMPPDALIDEVKEVWLLFKSGETGTPVVLHLAGLRGTVQGKEASEWVRIIARAKISIERERRIEDKNDSDDLSEITEEEKPRPGKHPIAVTVVRRSVLPMYYYRIPDLRNSIYIQNIQPLLQDINEFSVRSLKQALSARQILLGPARRGLSRLSLEELLLILDAWFERIFPPTTPLQEPGTKSRPNQRQ